MPSKTRQPHGIAFFSASKVRHRCTRVNGDFLSRQKCDMLGAPPSIPLLRSFSGDSSTSLELNITMAQAQLEAACAAWITAVSKQPVGADFAGGMNPKLSPLAPVTDALRTGRCEVWRCALQVCLPIDSIMLKLSSNFSASTINALKPGMITQINTQPAVFRQAVCSCSLR
jgi:hypothetical protein